MALGLSILDYAVDAPEAPRVTLKRSSGQEPKGDALTFGGAECKPCALAERLASAREGGRERGREGGTRVDNIAANLSDDSIKALAGLTTSTDECAEGVEHAEGTPCATKKILKAVAEFVVAAAPESALATSAIATSAIVTSALAPGGGADLLPTADTPEAIAVRRAAAVLGCTSESCVIAHPTLRQFVVDRRLAAPRALELELELRFKASGPRDSLALLSNYNLDETLQRWARVFPEFFPCPFAMMDFDSNGDYFGDADLPAILEGRADAELGRGVGRIRRPFKCFGCIVNTDTSRGPGKHWVAVFVDCRPPPGEPWTVEYFNSAGRPPPKPMLRWMERTRARLADYRASRPECRGAACDVVSVPVTDMDHQESQTECGLYALFYIRRRLEGTPYEFFEQQLVPDDAMTAFRQHVFRAA
jgi:hypothetical protein